ncbi:MAG TPA: CocE/NonD family hydrolase, partial [Gemmatimonadaceae bacterium]|nr:CocE/NonD family hydrolase [Gemmatimonadaceae bacterium]
PQAPQADWFAGDDTHHNGAFFLTSTFNFMAACGKKGSGSSMTCGKPFDFGTDDGYRFFLEMGPLATAEQRWFKDSVPGWSEMMRHGTYDAFWQARNLLPHVQRVKPAVLTVGGWYDANNFYGALHLYLAIERQSPGTDHAIVVGPWSHGQWARDAGRAVGGLSFGQPTSDTYQRDILAPFFEGHLKGSGMGAHPKAWVFETGSNRWRTFDQWPPREGGARSLFLEAGHTVALKPPAATRDGGFEEWVSDPANPVPFTGGKTTDMDPDYMAQDQRFAESRADVVTYRGAVLTEELTIAGPVKPTLHVATTGTDGDWVVKLIDVHPDGFQELVRGDVVRAKFRKSLAKPEPLVPGRVTRLDFEMPDVFHTFRRGHRILVQVQGSWFPLVDRNPQTFVDIYRAKARDFRPARQRVHRSAQYPSRLEVRVLPPLTVP